MSQKNNTPPAEESGSAGRRFRLPKLFADSADDTLPQELIDNGALQNATSGAAPEKTARDYSHTGQNAATPISRIEESANDTVSPARGFLSAPSEYSQRSENAPASHFGVGAREENATEAQRFAAQLAAQQSQSSAPPAAGAAYAAVLLQEMEQMREDMDGLSRTMTELREHGTAQDRIFDTLHAELQGYKNDFIYEHLKPVVRPLLFLYDSLEQFDGEMLSHEQAYPNERREFSPAMVRENVIFFRSQLVEALRICEVVPMEEPEGFFDPRFHKAIDAVAVGPELHRVVLRQVRSGWFLNGRVFRPAEVVVGRCDEENNQVAWNGESQNSSAESDHATA